MSPGGRGLCLLAALLLLSVACVSAESGWHYIGANLQQTGMLNGSTITDETGVGWTYNTNSEIHASAIVNAAGSRVYIVSSDNILHALDVPAGIGSGFGNRLLRASGLQLAGLGGAKVAWTFRAGGGTSSASKGSPCLSEDEKVVFIGTQDGHVVALNADTGKPMWTHSAGGAVSSSLVVARGRLYFGTQTTQFTALNVTTGKVEWSCNANAAIQGAASFSADGNTVYFTSIDTYVYAIDTVSNQCHPQFGKAATCPNAFHTGQLGCAKWYTTPNRNSISSSAVVDEENNGMVMVTTQGGDTGGGLAGLYGVVHHEFSYQIVPFFTLDSSIRVPVTLLGGNKTIIASDNHMVYGLDISTVPAKVDWKFNAGSAVSSTPLSDGKSVVFGTVGGDVYSLDAKSGGKQWVRSLSAGVTASPAFANDGIVVIGTIQGELYSIGAPKLLITRIVGGVVLLVLLCLCCACVRCICCRTKKQPEEGAPLLGSGNDGHDKDEQPADLHAVA